jgi:hypothetical protein
LGGQLLAKPDYIRAHQAAAARAERRPGLFISSNFYQISIPNALVAPDVAVQLDNPPAAGLLVQTVNILGDQHKIRKPLFHLGQGVMRRVGGGLCDQAAPPGIPFPHLSRIPGKRLRTGQLFRAEAGPQASLGISKGWHAAFGRHTCAGQGCRPLSLAQVSQQAGGKSRGVKIAH